ncbi:MAG: hypothetical protein ABSH16_05115 [Sedimentisphaerales bacterium]
MAIPGLISLAFTTISYKHGLTRLAAKRRARSRHRQSRWRTLTLTLTNPPEGEVSPKADTDLKNDKSS